MERAANKAAMHDVTGLFRKVRVVLITTTISNVISSSSCV